MAKPEKDPEYLSTLERGLSVLRAFDDQHPEMRLSEVAAVTGLARRWRGDASIHWLPWAMWPSMIAIFC